MITNLFRIFDPSSSSFIRNWISIFFIFRILPLTYYISPSRHNFAFFNFLILLKNDLLNNFKIKNLIFTIIFISLFILIFNYNFWGLLPYNFTPRRHIRITMSLAIPFWFRFLFYRWIIYTNISFAHLVPIRTPFILSFFIVLIETIRIIIRPLTLSIRLAANIIAGHLLLRLLRGVNFIPLFFLISFSPLVILRILELAVAIIQSYVFITLLSLYLNEI